MMHPPAMCPPTLAEVCIVDLVASDRQDIARLTSFHDANAPVLVDSSCWFIVALQRRESRRVGCPLTSSCREHTGGELA